jgi:hypothetical protein
MKRIAIVVLLATIGWSQTPADNAELKQIYEADQKDREATVDKMDWSKVGPRDEARRRRVRELMEQDKLQTGKDYERAAMVFQHGDIPDDFLLAHVLAVTAIGKGNPGARWLAAATLDRYLQRIGQPQIFGTQFLSHTENEKVSWTMEPYNRALLSPKLLDANCVPDPEDQLEMLKAFEKGEEPKPPKKQPCKK